MQHDLLQNTRNENCFMWKTWSLTYLLERKLFHVPWRMAILIFKCYILIIYSNKIASLFHILLIIINAILFSNGIVILHRKPKSNNI
jgi:hypothetical protein